MTCCVAALCEQRKAIVLVADRMLGTGIAQAELRINKIRPLHRDWQVMVAGDGIGCAFDIVDKTKAALGQQAHTVIEVEDAIARFFREKRLDEAAALGNPAHELKIRFLVAGFDPHGIGHLFTVSNPGICKRHDVPGFAAIGSGSFGAYYMMLWREIHIRMTVPRALYYVFESKIFGESAPGVGYETVMYVLRPGQKRQRISKKSEKRMTRIWDRLRPRSLTSAQGHALDRLPEARRLLG
jgi:20S proteasome alpha/beta subunit